MRRLRSFAVFAAPDDTLIIYRKAQQQLRIQRSAIPEPPFWAATKVGTEDGAIPANVLENILPTVMAGFAKEVELVKK